MAKIKFGMMMTDASGKLGGQVFSKNRSGSYVRTKVTPTNPQTTAQTAARSLFAQISQTWSSLSENRLNAWRSAVDQWQRTDVFGDLKRPTGKALYQRLNNQAIVAGYEGVTDPPEVDKVASSVIESVLINTNLEDVTVGNLDLSGDSKIMIFATPKLSQGTKFVKNKLRLIYTVTTDAYNDRDVYMAYTNKFGAPAVGDNIYFSFKYVSPTGNATVEQSIKADIEFIA